MEETEEENQPPAPNQLQNTLNCLSDDQQVEASINEASSLFQPYHMTESGFTTDNESQILAAVLLLSKKNQDSILKLSPSELASGLEGLVTKNRRDGEHIKSPDHK